MLDLSDGLKLGTQLYYFIPPILLMIIVPTIFAAIFAVLFRRILPDKIFNFFLVAVILLGLYVWAAPMETGFYEFFRATF